MGKENITHEFSLGKTDETRNYFIEEIKQNESIRKNHKKVCKVLKYIEHLLILASTVTGFVSSFAFASLIGIPVGIAISAVGIKICTITTVIKNYKSIIKKKNKKHVQIILLAKYELNSIELLISRDLIHSYISDDGFVLINNMLK